MNTDEAVWASQVFSCLQELKEFRCHDRVAFLLAWLRDVGSAFLPNVGFICKPLNVFAKSIHIRILKYVYGHNDLMVSGFR